MNFASAWGSSELKASDLAMRASCSLERASSACVPVPTAIRMASPTVRWSGVVCARALTAIAKRRKGNRFKRMQLSLPWREAAIGRPPNDRSVSSEVNGFWGRVIPPLGARASRPRFSISRMAGVTRARDARGPRAADLPLRRARFLNRHVRVHELRVPRFADDAGVDAADAH